MDTIIPASGFSQDRRVEYVKQERITQWLVGVLTTVTGVVGFLVWFLASSVLQDVKDIKLTMSDVRTHIEVHEGTSDIWIGRILSNENNIKELVNNVHARPDPFTGTEARALQQEASQSRKIIRDRLESMEERLDKLETDCSLVQFRLDAD